MNRYALWTVLLVVSNGLYAQNFLKSQNLDLCSYIWTITAEFVDPAPPSYGFDDYTNWTPQSAYYSSDRNGKCDLPFISVKAGQEGKAKLKIQYNTLDTSLNISVDENKITDFPSSLIHTTTFSFNTSLPGINNNNEYEKKYDAIMSAKITGIVDNILAESMIECYLEKEITVDVVRVNAASPNINPDFSYIANQAILNISVAPKEHSINSITTLDNQVQIIDSNTVWNLEMLEILANSYNMQNDDSTYTMFIIDGIILSISYTDINGYLIPNFLYPEGYSDPTNHVFWVLANRVSTRTSPHELGHCLGLDHRNEDKNALMCQSKYASGNNTQKLRQDEWDKIHR